MLQNSELEIFTFEYIELNYKTREDNLQQQLYCASIMSIIFADCQFYFPESPFFYSVYFLNCVELNLNTVDFVDCQTNCCKNELYVP